MRKNPLLFQNTDQPMRTGNDIERDYAFDLQMPNDNSEISRFRLSRNVARAKRMGLSRNSLSIVNPVDVLRQRVILELQRRKQQQQQHQIDMNRRLLETIGKRSSHDFDSDYQNPIDSSHNGNNNRIYTTEQQNDNQQQQQQQEHHSYTQRIPIDRTQNWYNVDDNVVRENGDEDTSKVLSTYQHDRM